MITKQELSASPLIQELTYINFATNRDQGMTAERYGSLFRNFPVSEYEARYLAEVGARQLCDTAFAKAGVA